MKSKKALFVGLRPIVGFVFGLIAIMLMAVFVQAMVDFGGGTFMKIITLGESKVDVDLSVSAEVFEKTASSACDISLMNFLRSEYAESITYAEQLAISPSDAELSAKLLLDNYIAEKVGTYSLKSGSFEIGELSGAGYAHCQQIIPSKTTGETILVTLEFGGEA